MNRGGGALRLAADDDPARRPLKEQLLAGPHPCPGCGRTFKTAIGALACARSHEPKGDRT